MTATYSSRVSLLGVILLLTLSNSVGQSIDVILAPSATVTASVDGATTDPVNGGSFIPDETYYVRERQASQLTSPLGTELFFALDLSGLDSSRGIIGAHLVVHHLDKLNDLDAPGNASSLEIAKVVEAWDVDGSNYSVLHNPNGGPVS